MAEWHDLLDNPQIAVYTQNGNDKPANQVFGLTRHRAHQGIDLFVLEGTALYACLSGKVVSTRCKNVEKIWFVIEVSGEKQLDIFRKRRRKDYIKIVYLEKVCKHLRHLFPNVVSYNRLVELEREVAVPLTLFIKKVLLGKCTGISFVDSTPLRVCKNQRIHIHKVFKGIAQRGKCSMGWFFGFKLHLICNEKGELLNFMITPGDVDDRKPLEYKAFIDFIYGKLVGDKGYIGKNLFQRLFVDGIQLVTKLKSNMKGTLMSVSDRLLLRKRAIIETVNDELKNIAQVEHSRHRCFDNFIVNLLGAIAAYCLFPKKPCINVQRTIDTQLTLF